MKKSMSIRKVMRSYQCMGSAPVENDREELLPSILNKRMRRSSSSSSSDDSIFDRSRDELSYRRDGTRQKRGNSAFSCVKLRSKRRKNLVTLLVGADQRVFKVEPHILEHVLFQCLIEKTRAERNKEELCGWDKPLESVEQRRSDGGGGSSIPLNCDAMLIEHLLWLLNTNDPSVRHINMDELMEFYS